LKVRWLTIRCRPSRAGFVRELRHSFVICREGRVPVTIVAMPQVPQTSSGERAPRVKLIGSVLALILLENKRQIRANLHQLSSTGGMLKLEKPLDEGIKVQLIFHIGSTTVRAKANLLFPMWATNGWLQPFQFVDLPDADRSQLESEVNALL
jgi:hypothetical protein